MSQKDQKPIEIDDDETKIVVGTYLSEEIKAKVKADAKENKRSVSSQISWMIEKYYEYKEAINKGV